MARNIPFDIIGSFDKSFAVEFDPQELVNCFVDTDPQGKNGKAIYYTPGLNLKAGAQIQTDKKGRRLYKFNNFFYWVVGSKIYRVDSSLNANFLGDINTESGYVGITDNGKEVIFVDGTGGWLWNTQTSSFTQISHVGFPSNPTDVGILGGRFVVNDAGSNVLAYSGIRDGTDWNALDEFAIGEDEVVGIHALNDRLFIMGKKNTYLWYDAGDPVLPFRPVNTVPYGCAAVGSIYESFGFLMWLSRDDDGVSSVVMTTGTQPQPVSNKPILTEFNRYETVDDATAFIYRNEQGHILYQINFTAENKSWACDLTERNRWSALTHNSKDRHLAEDHSFINGKHYVIDYSTSKLYHFSNEYITDDGVTIRRERIPRIFSDPNNRYITINSITFDMKQGVGTPSCGTSYDPVLRLRVSRDGGISYGDELTAEIGKAGRGEYLTTFYRLGRARSFVFKITMDNQVPFVLLNASINIDIQQEQT